LTAPWTFTWAGLLTAAVLVLVTGQLGVCLGYHRDPAYGPATDRDSRRVRRDLWREPTLRWLERYFVAVNALSALGLCWWPKAKDRQDTLDPEKQDPPGVLMVMEPPKDAGPVLGARR
jgi:hypothetical protein